MEKKNKKLVLLDAHAILHRAYHALPDFASSKGEPTGALYGLSTMLIKIINDLKPDYLVACYDLPKPTYRHEAYEDYKAGRKKAEEDLIMQMKRSRDVFSAFNIPIYDKEGFEADDILGTIVEKNKDKKDVDIVIASGDMDTLQLVSGDKVQVYTLKKGIKDTIIYNEKAVIDRFGFGPKLLPDFKGFRGDPSDNIIGIAGIGEKTASVLIQKFGSVEDIYKLIKKDKEKLKIEGIKDRIIELLEKGEEEALFSKMLATIRRDAPIDFVLPEKKWKESVEIEKILSLFTELDFRNLGDRIKESLALKTSSFDLSFTKKEEVIEEKLEKIDEMELKKAGIGLWLLDSNITKPSLEDVLNYTGVKNFEDAKKIILEKLEKNKLLSVFKNIEIPIISVIEKMEKRGVLVNVEYLKKLSNEYTKELRSLEEKIWDLAGDQFNINSPKQMGSILFDKLQIKVKNQKKTAGGAKSTKESELEKMKDSHPIIDLILKYRELQKLLSTYIDNIPNMLGKDGRLRAHFEQTGTTTGRMSSSDPNLQNIPIKTELGKKIRDAFIAEKGFKIVTFDYSQVELRIAAFLSKDKNLLEIFKGKEDVHSSVASKVFGVSLNQVDKEMRRKAKVINFGIIYGMGINALKTNLGVDREEAQNFYNEYFKNFSGLASFLEEIKVKATETGYTETYFGRRRYFEGIKSKIPYIQAAAERMAINAPIQGTCADMVKITMAKVDEYLKKNSLSEKVFLILQVHDELVYEIREEFVKEVSLAIKEIMEGVIGQKETKGLVFEADASYGDSWGEAKN